MRTTLLLLAASLSLASCASTSPNLCSCSASILVETPCLSSLDSLARLPAYLVPAPAGSSPRQRRQWQKAPAANLARAGVLPAKLKNSSLAVGAGAVATILTKLTGAVATGPGSSATSITRPRAPVATGAGSATDNTKAGQKGVASASGNNAHAEATEKTGFSYWWLLVLAAGLVYWQRKRLATLFV